MSEIEETTPSTSRLSFGDKAERPVSLAPEPDFKEIEEIEMPVMAEDEIHTPEYVPEAAEPEEEAEVVEEAVAAMPQIDTPAVDPDAPSVDELAAKRDRLDQEIKERQNAEKAAVIEQIRTVVTTYGITTDELVDALGGLKSRRKGVRAIPKYRDPATGKEWSGRGKSPLWIRGQNYDDFLIPEAERVRPE